MHFYTKEGVPCFEVPNISRPGHMRPTTKRDAANLGLYGSVTEKMKVIQEGWLSRWKMNNMLSCAFDMFTDYNNMKEKLNSRKKFYSALTSSVEALSEKPAIYGSDVHENIENYLKGSEYTPEWYIDDISKFITKDIGVPPRSSSVFDVERVAVNRTIKYAGTVDVCFRDCNGKMGIIDWKTKKTTTGKSILKNKKYTMQIAAYAVAAFKDEHIFNNKNFRAYICYISSSEKGRFEVKLQDREEMREAYEIFKSVCTLWDYI